MSLLVGRRLTRKLTKDIETDISHKLFKRQTCHRTCVNPLSIVGVQRKRKESFNTI